MPISTELRDAILACPKEVQDLIARLQSKVAELRDHIHKLKHPDG